MQSQAMLAKLLLSCTALLFLSTPVAAQAPSSKNITIIVPYATGGATDIVARIVAQQLGGRLGTPVIVENRQGCGGLERGCPCGTRWQYFASDGDVLFHFGWVDA